ncbi:hypothetical protein [Methylocystis rosea]|uniref:Nmad2 family putative nucleotide modification protein n=1 Tax=Methylocystis rosea TaxID=173366 RepID=UPI0013DE3DFB
MRVFSYKIARDYGFAPNPFHGVCTLATCKPRIRSSAQLGDIVVGCGCKKNGLLGRIICVLRVTGKCSFQDYWDNPRFTIKRPFFKGNQSRAYGDNIYHHDERGGWLQERSHHSFPDGSLNADNLARDTGCEHVLWSDDFTYFGRAAIAIPSHLRDFEGDDLYPNVRDARSRYSSAFVAAVNEWFETLPERGCRGRPGAWS